jgi:hypothetical protein
MSTDDERINNIRFLNIVTYERVKSSTLQKMVDILREDLNALHEKEDAALLKKAMENEK